MNSMIRKITAVMVVALIAAGSTVQGVALSDEVVRKLQKEGTLQTWVERMNQWRAAGMDQPLPRKDHDQLALSRQTAADSTVVILVDFYDQFADPANTPAAFDSLLFSVDKNPTGSMKEFYLQNSYGQYVLGGKAFGWYQPLGVNHQSYDGYDNPDDDGNLNAALLVQWAVAAADLDVDFSQFDTDHDGVLNGVIIIHSGYGAEESGNTTDIWSHMSSSPISTNDGVTIMSYTIQPEKSYSSKTMSAIGVFCHEWGHVMSLPDLYDTDGSCEGVGNWSLMGAGNYNGSSKRPAHLDAWSKYWLGWLELTNITANTTGIEVPAVEFNPVAYRLAKGGTLGTYEYFIVENREKIGFDDNLPGEGLLIYHIDYQAQGNWNDWHPKVFIEQADGKFDLQYGRNRGDGSDAYPIAGAARAFNDITVPNSRLYAGNPSQVAVWNIPDPDSVMTVDFDVFFSRPLLTLNSTSFNDQTYGDGDGTLDPEEKIQVSVSLSNEWAAANNISVTLSTDDPHLTVTVPTVSFGSLATGESANNTSLPFEFEIPTVINPRIDSFYFHVTANEGAFDTTLGVEYSIGNAKVLVVDDDNSDPNNLENYLVAPMYKLRAPVDIWNKAVQGSPDSAALAKYHAVLWLTGDYRANILTAEDVVAMATFMDGGGNLFLTGQGIAKQLSTFDPGFMADYLKSEYLGTKYVPVLKTDPSATVLNSPKPMVIQGRSGAYNQTAPDQITSVNGGMPELYFLNTADQTSTALKAAVLYSGTYKMAFFSFGFEAITADDADQIDRNVVFDQIMNFFGDLPTDVADGHNPSANLPYKIRLDQNFPNPFNPVTRISYAIAPDAGPRVDRTRLDVFNVLGQKVATLVDRDEAPGQYTVVWDGRDSRGEPTASGLYFYRLTRGSHTATQKMILLK